MFSCVLPKSISKAFLVVFASNLTWCVIAKPTGRLKQSDWVGLLRYIRSIKKRLLRFARNDGGGLLLCARNDGKGLLRFARMDESGIASLRSQ